ncbi:alpha/beta fold hydrolase [Alcaligenes endophyticus]|uniref:Alpha/beta hydrolase n=1 Tax=Alcaligenes endophyticus TaxID=1929088 RepID=A0ABT8EMU2_9BURK|nr:alpha/beta hydrolase [Alcaligenes endophyticus]MCX5590923.1 alpha/beta hydrolase [Alcaligenes endophyticus]MDN4122500.1 alpha/beta hydrolase [Alcaligenes endophyticus]
MKELVGLQQAFNARQYQYHAIVSGQGPLLLLIHGSLCDWRYWRWQIPELSEHYTVIAPSLRNYWPNAPSNLGFSAHTHAQDLLSLLQQYYPNQCVHILGHSRGAHVALELYRLYTTQVLSLVLADPGLPTGSQYSSQPLLDQVVQRLQTNSQEEALTLFIDTVNGSGTWRQMARWFKQMVADNANTLPLQQQEGRAEVDLHFLREADVPLYFITGEQSPTRYHYCMQLIAQQQTPLNKIVIEHAAHGMNLANPKAFNQAVLDCLKEKG